MKKEIQLLDYTKEILQGIEKGVLLTTKADGRVNSMTISWGTLGIEWGSFLFTTFVRAGRFTREQLDRNPEFTVNIPFGPCDKKILGICGTKSGRDIDKIKELSLTLEPSLAVSVPGIRELPLTLECQVVYRQLQDKHAIPAEFQEKFYPQDVPSSFSGSNQDYHIAYCGKIVKAYLIQ